MFRDKVMGAYHQPFLFSSSSSIIISDSQKQLPHRPHTDVHSAPLSDLCVYEMNFMHCAGLHQTFRFSVVKYIFHTDVLCLT